MTAPAGTTPLLEVRDLVKHYTARSLLGRERAAGARRGRRLVHARTGRDARAGRRVGMRQDHGGTHHHPAAGTDVGPGTAGWHRHLHARPRRAARLPPPGADDLPGSVRVAQPADDGGRCHRGGNGDPSHRHPAAAARPGRDPPRGGRSRCRLCHPLSARVLRRAAAAHRHRARARGGTRADHLRRAGLVAGRVGPGPGAEPAHRPAARAPAVVPLHCA